MQKASYNPKEVHCTNCDYLRGNFHGAAPFLNTYFIEERHKRLAQYGFENRSVLEHEADPIRQSGIPSLPSRRSQRKRTKHGDFESGCIENGPFSKKGYANLRVNIVVFLGR